MSRPLLSPSRHDAAHPVTLSAFASQVDDGLERVLATLAAAVDRAEEFVSEASCSASRASESALGSAVNVYRAACMSALAVLQPLSLASAAAAAFRETRGAEAVAEVTSARVETETETANLVVQLRQQLRHQQEEADTVQTLLKDRLAALDRTVRGLQAQQNVDFEKLEKLVKEDVKSNGTSPLQPPRQQQQQQQVERRDGAAVVRLSRWWGAELAHLEAYTRAALVADEAASRELVSHRRQLARAVVRAHHQMHDSAVVAVDAATPGPERALPTTRRVQVLESDVHNLAEYAATLQQDRQIQHTHVRGAVEATRESMQAVHLHALEQLAARYTEERRVLEERLADLHAALTAVTTQRDREAAQRHHEAAEARAALDAREAHVETLTRQLTSAKKRVWTVELEKDTLQTRVSVLARQLEDTVPRRAGSPARVERAAVRGSDPGRLFEGYRDQEAVDDDDDDGDDDGDDRAVAATVVNGTAHAFPSSAHHVDPGVWQRQQPRHAPEAAETRAVVQPSLPRPTRSASTITVTAVNAPLSSRVVSTESGLVTSPRASCVAETRPRRADLVCASGEPDVVSHTAQSVDRTCSEAGGTEETVMPSPSAWTSSSLTNSPAPKLPASTTTTDAPRAFAGASRGDEDGTGRARLADMCASLETTIKELEASMHQLATTHEVQRRHYQREARHLQTTRHYYEHALGHSSSAAHAGADRPHASAVLKPASADTYAAAQTQLTTICAQLEAIDAESRAEGEAFAVEMSAARHKHEQLMAVLRQVGEKQATLRT